MSMHLILNIEQGGIYCSCIAIYIDKDTKYCETLVVKRYWIMLIFNVINYTWLLC